MLTFLVIPADATPDDVAFPDRADRPTWQQLADEAGADGIENFGSAWCVENAIDGLGLCTEESGQESDKQRIAREAREADAAAVMVKRNTEAVAAAVAYNEKLLAALQRKGVLDAADIDEITTARVARVELAENPR